MDFNKEFVGEDYYNEISDSIENYFALLSKHGLRLFRHIDGKERKYHRSPIIAFNTKKNRLAGSIIFDSSIFQSESEYKKYKYNIGYSNYFGYKHKGDWYFMVAGGQHIASKEYLLKESESDVLKDEILINLTEELLNGTVLKGSNNMTPNDRWFEGMLESNGWHSYGESMSKEDYKNAPDEFWEQKYFNAMKNLRMQIDSIQNSNSN